jgi:acyl-CoA reductase-like NAD-dependent aldehyde dehydrogenase
LGRESKVSRLAKPRRIQGREKKMTGTRLNDCDLAPSEKAKYENATPDADVMKQLDAALQYDPPHHYVISDGLRQRLLYALTAYGDQRARDAHMLCAKVCVDKIREARASALEEAAQLCDDLWVGSQGKSVLAPKIRALINKVKS